MKDYKKKEGNFSLLDAIFGIFALLLVITADKLSITSLLLALLVAVFFIYLKLASVK